MIEAKATEFAQEWIAAWNAHDLDRVLAHYTEDFSIDTPMAAIVVPESNGSITGKAAIRSYWSLALARVPDLAFVLIDVLAGIDSITIYYSNTATGRKSAEVLFFNDAGMVERAVVHYS